jgi:hypothetical protein
MMKRVTAALFLLIFALSTAVRAMERTEAWVAQHASKSKYLNVSRTGQPTAELHKQNPQAKQTKLLEDGWGLHVSFIRSSNTPPSTNALAHPLTGFATEPNDRALSLRAPPSLLS